MDQQRIPTEQTAIEVAIAQLRVLVPLLGRPVIILADRWYATDDFCVHVKRWGTLCSFGSSATGSCTNEHHLQRKRKADPIWIAEQYPSTSWSYYEITKDSQCVYIPFVLFSTDVSLAT